MNTLPPVFLSHGSPMTALQPGATGAFWRQLGHTLRARHGRPRAVLAVSAHSLARQPTLLAADQHPAVHDFSGFPPELYRLRYDAAGAPALADEVAALLRASGHEAVVRPQGGLDHGIWTPLRSIFPDADVPVLPLAFPPAATPSALRALGQSLAPLAGQGVWVLGSGSLTHNLRLLSGRPTGGSPEAAEPPELPECRAFRDWVQARGAASDWPALLDYRRQAPHAALMHPSDEHWLPFYVAAGAAGHAAPAHRLHAGLTYGCLAMDAYGFGDEAAALACALDGQDRLPA